MSAVRLPGVRRAPDGWAGPTRGSDEGQAGTAVPQAPGCQPG
jgi:hypothetical protein